MTRKKARECAVLLNYEMGFHPDYDEDAFLLRLDELCSDAWFADVGLSPDPPVGRQREYLLRLLRGIAGHQPELDAYIGKYSIGWKVHRIPRVAVAIMQIAFFEIVYMPEIPPAASIDAAVELAKRYETPEIASFVNGVLGGFVRTECLG